MKDKRLTVGYTIFNKGYLIPDIIGGFENILNEDDEFIIVFDNCTDDSWKQFEENRKRLKCFVKPIIYNEDQFEVKANNAILQDATYDTMVLFQDDIINKDQNLREKICDIIPLYKDTLGLMGGRSGFELDGYSDWPEKTYNRVSNWEHKASQYGKKLDEGGFAVRTFLNRGPIVFTRKLLEDVGYLSESYYPLWGDDLDYCARSVFIHKKINIVFQCNVESKLEWGATHKKGKSKIDPNTFKSNWYRFVSQWGEQIKNFNKYENITLV